MSWSRIIFSATLCILIISQISCFPVTVDRFASVIKQSANKYDTGENYYIINTCRINSQSSNLVPWYIFLDENCNLARDCLYGVLYNQNSNVDNTNIVDEYFNKPVGYEFANKAYKSLVLGASRANPKYNYYVIWDIEIDNTGVLIYKIKYFNSRENSTVFYSKQETGLKFMYDSTIPEAQRFDALNDLSINSVSLKDAFYSLTDGESSLPNYSVRGDKL